MKTGITVIITEQTGQDSYKDVKITKVFNDTATLGDIKVWIKSQYKSKLEAADMSLASVDISDVKD